MRCLAAAAILCSLAASADAVTPAAYRDVGVSVPPGAAVPLDVMITDESGHVRALRDLLARPAVVLFADYTCTTLCGPIVDFAVSALEKSGLQPQGQYVLIAIGLDPKDGAPEARALRQAHLPDGSPLADAASFVTADQDTLARLTTALGYRYAYDAEHDQFVHPAAAYVLRPDGRVSRVLTGIGLSAADMRLALVEAGEGKIGTASDQVRLLCSGFDPISGAYNLMIGRVLAVAAGATVLTLAGGIGLLLLAGRRRAA